MYDANKPRVVDYILTQEETPGGVGQVIETITMRVDGRLVRQTQGPNSTQAMEALFTELNGGIPPTRPVDSNPKND